jgi:hypothetical protein
MRAAVDMQHFTGHERRVGEIEYGIDDLGDFPDRWIGWSGICEEGPVGSANYWLIFRACRQKSFQHGSNDWNEMAF